MNRIIVLVREGNQNHEQDSLKNIILFYLSEKEIKTLRMFHWVQLILTNFQIPITVDAIDFSRLRLKDKRFQNVTKIAKHTQISSFTDLSIRV